ncbi:MAG: tRNA-queuosine alpha-mannosyltransferase domain-containing protein [Coriobacteriia bacterium]
MHVLALEPYYGGSHRAVLDGLVASLSSRGIAFELLTLPPRKWKWRMRGSAITFAEQARALSEAGARWDVVFASTFVNLAEFLALAGAAVSGVPAVVYFHENQLLYPTRHTAEWDYQFALTNITSALAADRCLFNSRYNRDGFLDEIPGFLREFPDHRPRGVAERIAAKSSVLPPPFDPAPFDAVPVVRGKLPRIVWPHRWEHDKDPQAFFAAVDALAAEGRDFEVAVAGQAFRETGGFMHAQAAQLGSRLVHIGEPGSRRAYAALLAGADVAVSTAHNEFFGVAMMEACYAGCAPIVPDRLAYRELYPPSARYASHDQLVARLRDVILERPEPGTARDIAMAYTFDALADRYAQVFSEVAGSRT